jgi:hypothetical protein
MSLKLNKIFKIKRLFYALKWPNKRKNYRSYGIDFYRTKKATAVKTE